MNPTSPRLARRFLNTAWLTLLWLGVATHVNGHDTFLRVPDYVVAADQTLTVTVFHGTFDTSVYRIDANHVASLVVQGPSTTQAIPMDTWALNEHGSRPWVLWQRLSSWSGGVDERLTSSFTATLPGEGTHVLGMALHPAGAAMSPETFHAYLKEQGIEREPVVQLDLSAPGAMATERWSKFVKTIIQAGKRRTENVTRPLGHAVEFVPAVNPLDLKPPCALVLQLLRGGLPLPDQVVLVGRQKPAFGGEPAPHVFLRSDAEGRITLHIGESGVWWLSFVHMARAPEGDEVQLISQWATLTFEVQ